MATGESFPMNGGNGTFTYSKNSNYQRKGSSNLKEKIEDAIVEGLDMDKLMSSSNAFRIVDLGCSVGPNTFIAMENVIKAVQKKYQYSQVLDSNNELQFQVFFNDHVSNDFNTLFASFPHERQYFAAGVPGSFYDQLFPSSSIHLAHSSYALQWLSKSPSELSDKDSRAWNKDRIHYAGAACEVVNAYSAQFAKDMESFLAARAKETAPGGLIVIMIPGLPDGVPHSGCRMGILFNFLGSILLEMANEGIIDGAEIDSLNLPIYAASVKEMSALVEKNGCFSIERMEMNDKMSKIGDNQISAQSLIGHLRAGLEGVFTKHFESHIVEEMFSRTSQNCPEISRLLSSVTQLFAVLKRK